MEPLNTLLIKSLVGVLVINTLLASTASVRTALSVGALELVDSSTGRILVRADLGSETGVLLIIRRETTLVDVATVRLSVLVAVGNIVHIGRGLAGDVARATTAGSRVLAGVHAHLLLRGGGTTSVALFGVGTGEVTLATETLGVLLLALTVVTEATNGSGRKLSSGGCVGVVQSRLAAGDAQGLGAAVLRESTALADGLRSEGIVGNGARRLLNGILVGRRVGSDLGAAGAVRERSALEIHGDYRCVGRLIKKESNMKRFGKEFRVFRNGKIAV